MSEILSDAGLDQIFRDARTHSVWQDTGVSDVLLEAIYDLAKMGPTSANCSPMRVLFLRSKEAKERLRPALDAGNVDKTMAAPATAILAYDMEFYEKLPALFPHADARSWFAGKPKAIEQTAQRNGSLQGAYFIIAARALGLDCGPMSGFNRTKVDEVFFADTPWRSNFLCNLGHGDPEKLHPRSPRLDFDEACRLL
ncbi:malonic semialdehyde reductase [Pelagibius litoralis]|uniref:Putative NADH dehydrogenase/NAD(P)H nitroreductase HBA54_28545 n=1 Tax=Pelagibius litoralis TaxID=374515 RepID=A0A967KC66_9PROT|nr:malonic semialdehyde reductase [Pelagibius litoralis]NIA72538.1 malonic semialdehyde reductase [Pelagibius litoralis]